MQNKMTSMMIFSLIYISTILGVLYLNTHELLFMLLASFLIGLFVLFTSSMLGFALLIVYVLGHGFYSVGVTWGKEININIQSIQILKQCIYTLSAVASWLLIYSINKARESYISLEKEVIELRKLEPFTDILTFNEFMERAKLLITGMRRRGETAYYLVFEVIGEKDYQKRVVYEKLTKLLLQSVRVNYDLVGKGGHNRIIVLLSNTNEEGVQIVLQRLAQKVDAEYNLTLKDFIYSIHDVGDDFATFSEAVASWKRGNAS